LILQNHSQLIIYPDSIIRTAINTINRGLAQVALVVNEQQCLVGTITDGDIRRALLRGKTMESTVESVMHREFRWVNEGAKEAEVLAMMRQNYLQQIPVLDKEGTVVRLFLLKELLEPQTLPNWVVLMAGGEGSRLRPLTERCPKPMLPINGKPLMEILLERCVEDGLRHFYFAVNYLKQQIIDHFGDGSRWGVNINYLEESQPLGTAGAIRLLPEATEHPLLVINGDILTQVPFQRLLLFHQENQATATICVREHKTVIPFGVVKAQGTRVVGFEEKPTLNHYVNAGVYVLNPEVFHHLPKEKAFDMPLLIERFHQKQLPVHVFPIHEYWLDVGLPETLEQAQGEW